MQVHVAGNVCIDTTFRLDRFPQAGETLNAASHSSGVGGKGANQAVAAARTGVPVTLWAGIGKDVEGEKIRQTLATEINHSQLTEFDEPSDCSTIILDATGENCIVSGISCANAFNPLEQTAFRDAMHPGDFLIMQANLHPPVTSACLAAAKGKDAITILNASPIAKTESLDLSSVDFIIVNQGEATQLTDSKDPECAAHALIGAGAQSAVITLGAQGCLLLTEKGAIQIPAPPANVVDSSGAGDILCGVFAGCLAKQMQASDALQVAVHIAALAVARPGTLASCPSKNEILSLLKTMEAKQV